MKLKIGKYTVTIEGQIDSVEIEETRTNLLSQPEVWHMAPMSSFGRCPICGTWYSGKHVCSSVSTYTNTGTDYKQKCE